MSKEEAIEKLKPYMYCFMGSGMLSNTYDENVATSFAEKSFSIMEEYSKQQSIAFAEWFPKYKKDLVEKITDKGEWLRVVNLPTEYFYNLFIQTQNNQL